MFVLNSYFICLSKHTKNIKKIYFNILLLINCYTTLLSVYDFIFTFRVLVAYSKTHNACQSNQLVQRVGESAR